MSQFCTMTTRERKIQAAAICREVQGQEDCDIDLGKKVSMPKEIMLEELSLSSNRGSRLFKMRQRRSEKYTFESIQNTNNIQLNSTSISHVLGENAADYQHGENNFEEQLTDTRTASNTDSFAPGYASPLKELPEEKFNSTAIPKSYHSPWSQAIISDPGLADTLTIRMPDPEQQPDRPVYKCFNRVATPFGGFSRSSSPAPIKSITLEPLPDFSELQTQTPAALGAPMRPSFNRSALGWVSSSHSPAPIITVSNEPAFIPESDDL